MTMHVDFPGAGAVVFGRDELVEDLVLATEVGQITEIVGLCGSGRSTLLDLLAEAIPSRLGRVVVKATAADTAADTLRSVPGLMDVDTCHRSRRRRAAGFHRAGAVLLDDVTWDRGEVSAFLARVRGHPVVLACDRPVLGSSGSSMHLPGLEPLEATALFEHRLGRPVTPVETAHLSAVIHAIGGRPLAVLQAAALLGDRSRHLDLAHIAAIADQGPEALDRLAVESLPPQLRRVVHVLAFVGGAMLPTDVLAALADLDDSVASFRELTSRHVITSRQDRYGLPACRASVWRREAVDAVSIGRAARILADALVGDRDPSATLDLADAGVRLVRLAAERREWNAVLRLVNVVEPALTLAGRWDTAREMLRIGIEAARELHDLAVERLHRDRLAQVPATSVTDPGPSPWPRRIAAGAILVTATASLLTLVANGASRPPPERTTTGSTTVPGSINTTGTTAQTDRSADSTVSITVTGSPGTPRLWLPGPLTVEATSESGAAVTFDVRAEGSTGRPLAPVCSPASGATFALGRTNVTCRVSDRGTAAIAGTFSITVVDTRPPTVVVEPTTFEADDAKGARAPTFTVRATDLVSGTVPATCDLRLGEVLPIGKHPMICTATDAGGNTANVSVILRVADSRGPVISGLPRRISAAEGTPVVIEGGLAVDAVDGPVPLSCPPTRAGQVGTRLFIVCTATDRSGNASKASIRVDIKLPPDQPELITDGSAPPTIP